MTNIEQNNKRIAKNTLLLYFRMLLTMAISLYTSRIVLSILGVEDYGIYNVVGGVVSMFSVVSGSLTAAISRFITYEIGKGDKSKLQRIFSSAITIQIILSLIIILLAETIGLWFLNIKMNIPDSRMYAANWVFQLSIITFTINLISVPYNATIIAHEKMSAFAYISILEVLFKLIIVYLLLLSSIDKLILYSILMAIVALAVRFVYGYYCKRHFEECSYHFLLDKKLLNKMFSFAGWNFIGASSAILRDQGGNIIINLFCGPSVNAARGIAYQVSNAIQGFVGNFMMAVNPQITKSYAAGNRQYMMTLIFQGARLSYYILLLLSLPVIINTHYILSIWLKDVPEHTTLFVKLVLVFAMSESISTPLVTAMLATGKIRNYQVIVGGLQMMNLPISYILLKNGYIPETVLIIAICISQCCLVARLYLLRNMINLDVKIFINKVYFNVITVTIASVLLPAYIAYILPENFINFIIICGISLISVACNIFLIGCNQTEKKIITQKLTQYKDKYFH